jgi:1,4-dihydroxy-2-naphthoate octaprenyltransferase
MQNQMRFARPALFAAGGILLYALGAGIARFLGEVVDWRAYLLGQVCVSMLQLSAIFLKDAFTVLQRPSRSAVRQAGQLHFAAAATALTIGAVMTVLLYRFGYLNPEAFLILAVAFLLSLAYAAPPLRLCESGYGDLANAFLVANLFPALAFLLQAGHIHRLLAMATFPLTPLFLAMMFALGFPAYAQDVKENRRSLLVQIGWQRSMSIHNWLLAASFLLLAVSVFFGLSWQVAWPALLAAPLALFQIWQMSQIANGLAPRWTLLVSTALASFAVTAYLLTFAFWVG